MILKSHQHLFLAVLVFLISAGVKAGEADAVETPADTAAAAIEKLGGVVWTKTSQSGEQYVEVDIRASRRWIGGGEGFKHLDAIANVSSLVIQGIDQFGDQEMAHLRGLCELRSLSLMDTQVTDDGLVYLRDLPSIEWLSLSSRSSSSPMEHWCTSNAWTTSKHSVSTAARSRIVGCCN